MRLAPPSPLGEKVPEGRMRGPSTRRKEVAPHQLGQMTYGRAIDVVASGSRTLRGRKSWPRVLSPDGERGARRRARSPRHQNLARILIPALLGRAHNCVVARLRRDVDAHPSFTWRRPAPGRTARMARRSRRPGLTGSGEAPVMAGSRCPPSVAQGAIAKLCEGPSGKPKYGPGQKSPNAGAERQPPGP